MWVSEGCIQTGVGQSDCAMSIQKKHIKYGPQSVALIGTSEADKSSDSLGIPVLSNLRPAGRMRPVEAFCVARQGP